jgi:hypothetical protein
MSVLEVPGARLDSETRGGGSPLLSRDWTEVPGNHVGDVTQPVEFAVSLCRRLRRQGPGRTGGLQR